MKSNFITFAGLLSFMAILQLALTQNNYSCVGIIPHPINRQHDRLIQLFYHLKMKLSIPNLYGI